MTSRIIGFLAFCLAWCLGSDARADDRLLTSTVWIRAGDRSTGTGFVINVEKRWVLTAWHVVGDQSPVEVFFRDPDYVDHHRDTYLRNRDLLRKAGRCVAGAVIAKLEIADLALIRLESIPRDSTAIEIATIDPEAGAGCHSVGHRLDPGALWLRTDGTIRQTGLLKDGYASAGKKIGSGVRVHYAQMPIEIGDSGSAAVNSQGRVIGLVSALAGRAPGTAILISSAEINKFIGEIRSKTPTEANPKNETPAALSATVWIRPESTDGRFAGVIFSTPSGDYILTSSLAVGDESRADIIFPKLRDGRLVTEEGEYADRLGLYLGGNLRPAIVLHVDRARDLALLKTVKYPDHAKPLRLASNSPRSGDKIMAVSHPLGVELRWLLSSGSIRGEGNVVLHPENSDKPKTIGSWLLQLPHQGNCSGGPVVNASGELLGILASREGPRQETAYCANAAEVNQFLGASKCWQLPESIPEILALARKFELIDRLAAKEVVEKGLRKYPADYQLQAERLLMLRSVAEIKNAFKSMQGNPKTSMELLLQGKVMQRIGDNRQAAKAYEAAVEIDNLNVPALVARASLLDGKEAEPYLTKAALIEPNYPGIHRVRAAKLPRTTNDERRQVIDELTRLLEWEAYDSSARRERAELFREVREFKKAEADELRLTEITPGDANSWFRLAETRLLQFKQPIAIVALRSAMRVQRQSQFQCLRIIIDHAQRLEQDDPKDLQRIYDWLQLAIQGLSNELPVDQAKQFAVISGDSKLNVAEKNRRILERIGSWKD